MNAQAGPVLRDIHLPPEPSWWPPAPGWWVLAMLLLLLCAWLLRRVLRQRRLSLARRSLQHEFDAACVAHPSSTDAAGQVAALSLLLRRATKQYAPQALALRDEDWLAFLDDEDAAQPFRRGAGRLMLDGPFRPRVAPEEADALAQAVRARLERFVTPAHV